jgi:hypothetical protein
VFFHLLFGACRWRRASRPAPSHSSIAPTKDLSLLANKNVWPPHLMSVGRRIIVDGVTLGYGNGPTHQPAGLALHDFVELEKALTHHNNCVITCYTLT